MGDDFKPAGRISGRMIGLQWLRAIAALMVLMAHNHDVLLKAGAEPYDGWLGGLGVDIFFVISGYIMFSVMAGMPRGHQSAWKFTAHRIGRIAPIYWLITAAVIIVWFMTGETMSSELTPENFAQKTFRSVIFISQHPVVVVGWTLAFEMMFYALSALALLITDRQARRFVVVASLLLAFVALRQIFGLERFYPGDTVVLEFAMGAAIWLAFDRLKAAPPIWAGYILLLFAVGGMVALYGSHDCNHGDTPWIICSTLMVAGTVIAEPAFRKLPWRWPVTLGDASYFLYLTHLYVILWVFWLLFDVVGLPPTQWSAALFTLSNILLASVISIVSFTHLERPMTRRATKWLERRRV